MAVRMRITNNNARINPIMRHTIIMGEKLRSLLSYSGAITSHIFVVFSIMTPEQRIPAQIAATGMARFVHLHYVIHRKPNLFFLLKFNWAQFNTKCKYKTAVLSDIREVSPLVCIYLSVIPCNAHDLISFISLFQNFDFDHGRWVVET